MRLQETLLYRHQPWDPSIGFRHLKTHSGEKSNKCAQWDIAGNLRTCLKTQTNANSVILYLSRQEIWGDIWKHTVEKSQTNVTILEILKSKNSLHAHFMLKSIHSFFIWCKTTKILTLYQNFKKIAHIWGVIVEKLKGGSRKAEILVVFKLQYL